MAKKRKPANRAASPISQAGLLEPYRDLLAPDDFSRLFAALQVPLPQAIRINPLKVAEPEARQRWTQWYGWEILPVPFCPTGWQLLSAQQRPSQTPEYKLGNFFIQEAASMLPVELFDFSNVGEPLILDLAAAPGGKSTHLTSRSGDRGLLVANDSSRGRIAALRAALQDWGAMNTLVTHFPGEKFGAWFPEMFDLVLLDAPCSMENLRLGAGHSKRLISSRERQGLAGRQLRLLTSAFQAVKPGGQVVYATCTLAPEEDEAVLDGLLRQYSGYAQVDSLADLLPDPAPALARVGASQFHPEVQKAVRLWPHLYGTSGFFAARLTKLEALDLPGQPPPQRPFEKTGLISLDRHPAEQRALLDEFEDHYGLDLGAVLRSQGLSLWQRETSLYALSEQMLQHFSSLPFEAAGFLVGDIFQKEAIQGGMTQGIIPSHEMVARWGKHFRRGVVRISLDEAGSWMAGSDLQHRTTEGEAAVGVVAVIDERGRLLGRGKILTDRLKNMLPRRLVS